MQGRLRGPDRWLFQQRFIVVVAQRANTGDRRSSRTRMIYRLVDLNKSYVPPRATQTALCSPGDVAPNFYPVLSSLRLLVEVFSILGHPDLEFSGVKAHPGGDAGEPFISEIGDLLPNAKYLEIEAFASDTLSQALRYTSSYLIVRRSRSTSTLSRQVVICSGERQTVAPIRLASCHPSRQPEPPSPRMSQCDCGASVSSSSLLIRSDNPRCCQYRRFKRESGR